jgi:hypothetical protein
MLARVPVANAESFKDYEFWTGAGWSKDVKDCQPVMRRIEHGQIFATKVFGEFSDSKYCFVGCSSDGDSKVLMARARSPEGPWDDGYDLKTDLYKSPFKQKPPKYYYCMYPHPWALGFDTYTKTGLSRTGDLMITWSEGGLDGHVLASAVKFEMEERRYEDVGSNAPEVDDTKWNHGPDSSPGRYVGLEQFGTGGGVQGGATYGGSMV